MNKNKLLDKKKLQVLSKIAGRVHFLLNQMIYLANHRTDQQKGDPKVGGHPSASTSSLHILGVLHLVVKSGFDLLAHKPHTSPTDHAYNYLLDLFLDKELKPLSSEMAEQAMYGLRAFPKEGGFVFQSYHSTYDPDHHNFLPSGTVGIPPVVLGYMALAYRALALQGYKTPKAHFWALIGDSEFREGSLMEALPDLAEREVGNLTWIVDYNRQSLDGHRLVNDEIIKGSDADRIHQTLIANGWEVLELKHGSLRQKMFQKPGGQEFKQFLEQISDPKFQSLFPLSGKEIRKILSKNKKLQTFLKSVTDSELKTGFMDLGGHDFEILVGALEESKKNQKKPCLIIAHTIKGWGLEMAGLSGNHSYLVSKQEIEILREKEGIDKGVDFPRFDKDSESADFLKSRREILYKDILAQHKMKAENIAHFKKVFADKGSIDLNIDFQKMSYPHTQWFLGQVMAKLARIAGTKDKKLLKVSEQVLQPLSRLIYSMSPDVGTSTNLSAAMNQKTLGPEFIEDENVIKGLEDKKSPDLIPHQESQNRFVRFEIVEANCISCMAAFGKVRDILGTPLLPLMTVYDFFIKRALDQYFYTLYWNSSFILCGTPSGVTLSPEGAQHGWKSDFQIPNQITWEPFFLQEMEWIMSDAIYRHFTWDNEDRTGVLVRAVTRGADQKQFLQCLKTQKRFKQDQQKTLAPEGYAVTGAADESELTCISESEILAQIKQEVLSGAYYLLDYRGYVDYIEEDNVVYLFSMGSPSTSALAASKELLKQGIYANVIVVTSPDLLLGNLANRNNYSHLRNTLELKNIKSPVVSVHDGEPGLLDNIGSVLAVHQESLAVRKHSLCGRPEDVYKYHKMDKDSVIKTCLKVLTYQSNRFFLK